MITEWKKTHTHRKRDRHTRLSHRVVVVTERNDMWRGQERESERKWAEKKKSHTWNKLNFYNIKKSISCNISQKCVPAYNFCRHLVSFRLCWLLQIHNVPLKRKASPQMHATIDTLYILNVIQQQHGRPHRKHCPRIAIIKNNVSFFFFHLVCLFLLLDVLSLCTKFGAK